MALRRREKLDKRRPSQKAARSPAHPGALEPLETRQLLSATADPLNITSPSLHGGVFNGYTPAQIRHAYGFDQVNFTGAGQTIAIVDAFDDPTILADLKVFDAKYGLPDPVLTKVNQSGRRIRGLTPDAGWASEIALDVEWAHAIAPGAAINLIETNSDNTDDLLAGVMTARSMAGVSVVSLSWGSSEYRGEGADDATFTTPSGHQGVTFLAASGDEGHAPAEWPATSPNVVAVGGTTLKLTSTGQYASESVWTDTTGGVSSYEPLPSYQANVTGTSARSTPDVSYNANPDTGFAVYDSYGSGGWTVVAGTSAGVPQWGALVALADQARVSAGKPTLDSGTGTLPALYSLSPNSSMYTAAYNDVTTGSNAPPPRNSGGGGWGHYYAATPEAAIDSTPTAEPSARAVNNAAGTSSGGNATVGYDEVSGLGTPKAATVVSALAGYVAPVIRTRRRRGTPARTTAHHAVAVRNPPPVQQSVTASPPAAPSINATPAAFAPGVTFIATETPALIHAVLTFSENHSSVTVLGSTSPAIAPAPTPASTFGGTSFSAPVTTAIVPAATALSTAVAPLTTFSSTQLVTSADVILETPAVAMTGSALTLSPLDAASVFGDALALFAHESTQALLPTEIAATVEHKLARPRAWAITLGVLATDAVLVGRWMARRARPRRAANNPFALAQIATDPDTDDDDF